MTYEERKRAVHELVAMGREHPVVKGLLAVLRDDAAIANRETTGEDTIGERRTWWAGNEFHCRELLEFVEDELRARE